MKKGLINTCLAFCLVFVLFLVRAQAANTGDSGSCGNLTWTLDSEGLLTIDGTGAMPDYDTYVVASASDLILDAQSPWIKYSDDISAVVLHDGVTSIGAGAFASCTNLASVTIPSSVTIIGDWAFYCCFNMTDITIPSSVTSIGDRAFRSCNLRNISLPNSVTSIGDRAFYYCSNLRNVSLPGSVTSIGAQAFSNCDGLTGITVAAENPAYCSDDGVLFNKSKTELIQYPIKKDETSYIIPDGVTSIGAEAFDSCTNLISVTLPSSVTSIGDSAFSGCFNLTDITIPSSVMRIGDYAFFYCSKLADIKVAAENPAYCSIDGVLFNKSKTKLIQYPKGKDETSYIIPDGVTSIEDWSFRFCNLRNITIPSSVTSIGDLAFGECGSLTGITIPSSVTSIGDSTFSGCFNLTDITIPSSVTSIGEWAFSYCSNLSSINISTDETTIGVKAFNGCTSLSLISFENKTIPFGAMAYVAVYSADGKMLALEKPFLVGVEPALLLPAEVYHSMKTAKLLIIDSNSFVPSGACGTFTKA